MLHADLEKNIYKHINLNIAALEAEITRIGGRSEVS